MTIYGYARVSGTTQDLTAQVAELKEKGGCVEVFQEKITGTTKDRPEFQRMLSVLEAGDTLTVTKLDRFARTATDGIGIIRDLMSRGVRVSILNMGVVEDTTTGRLMLTILSGFAEFERDMIVERLAEGKAIAKQRDDFREGRPNVYTTKQLDHAMTLLNDNSYTEVERLTGISKSTLTRYKRKQNSL